MPVGHPFWTISANNKNKSLLTKIRSDLVRTWHNYLLPCSLDNNESIIGVNHEKSIVQFASCPKYKVAIIIPFRDQVQLLVNCVDSLMHRKEEIELIVYAVNNDSCEPETFNALDRLKDKYPNCFVCKFAWRIYYAKINEAVSNVAEDYILFNNDIWLKLLCNYYIAKNAFVLQCDNNRVQAIVSKWKNST